MTVTQQLVLAAVYPGRTYTPKQVRENVNSNDLTSGQIGRALQALRRAGEIVYYEGAWSRVRRRSR